MMKTLTVTHGPRHNPVTIVVELPGELADAKLTPAMARRAARIAAGHEYGVTVTDGGGYGYRLYSPKRNSHRKFRVVE